MTDIFGIGAAVTGFVVMFVIGIVVLLILFMYSYKKSTEHMTKNRENKTKSKDNEMNDIKELFLKRKINKKEYIEMREEIEEKYKLKWYE